MKENDIENYLTINTRSTDEFLIINERQNRNFGTLYKRFF